MSNNSTTLNNKIVYEDINNTNYKCLYFLVAFSMTIMITKGIFSYKLVEFGGYILQAGQFISPVWFILFDIISEVYGYRIAKSIIISNFVCQIIFAIFCLCLIHLPHPKFWQGQEHYLVVLGNIWRVSGAVLIAFVIAGFINIKIISRWKILAQGKLFWLRSIGASGISEFLFSVISTFLIQFGKQNFNVILHISLASAILKFIYSITFALPANLIVLYLKKLEKIEDNF